MKKITIEKVTKKSPVSEKRKSLIKELEEITEKRYSRYDLMQAEKQGREIAELEFRSYRTAAEKELKTMKQFLWAASFGIFLFLVFHNWILSL